MSTANALAVATKRSGAVSRQERHPTNEEIAARAYDIFLSRGACDGSDLDDWLRAERELQDTE